MVKRTLELFECDKCGAEGRRYTVTFPEEGTLVLDRCEQHAKKIEALRNETGEWLTSRGGKQAFRKSSPAEIRQAIEAARIDGTH